MQYGFLSNVNTDQIAYATQASEGAYIVSQNGENEVMFEILRDNYKHTDEKMYIALYKTRFSMQLLSQVLSIESSLLHKDIFCEDIIVEFEVKHSYFNALVKAVNKIPSVIVDRVLPIYTDFCRFRDISIKEVLSFLAKVPYYSTIHRRDDDQFRALCKILTCIRKSPPVIVNGSFGTGKTRLLAVVTNCIIQYGIAHKEPVRVLVCAHHQASADSFVEKFFGPMFGHRSDIELVRLMSWAYRYRSSTYFRFYKATDEYVSQAGMKPLPENLIIVTTFLTAPSLCGIFKPGDFTHILLDEGSQSREPETIGPFSLAGLNTKLVIAGDSHQVP